MSKSVSKTDMANLNNEATAMMHAKNCVCTMCTCGRHNGQKISFKPDPKREAPYCTDVDAITGDSFYRASYAPWKDGKQPKAATIKVGGQESADSPFNKSKSMAAMPRSSYADTFTKFPYSKRESMRMKDEMKMDKSAFDHTTTYNGDYTGGRRGSRFQNNKKSNMESDDSPFQNHDKDLKPEGTEYKDKYIKKPYQLPPKQTKMAGSLQILHNEPFNMTSNYNAEYRKMKCAPAASCKKLKADTCPWSRGNHRNISTNQKDFKDFSCPVPKLMAQNTLLQEMASNPTKAMDVLRASAAKLNRSSAATSERSSNSKGGRSSQGRSTHKSSAAA